MKKQREEFLQNKQNFFKGELQYKEIVFEYNKKIMEREKQLKFMRKKLDFETKNYNVKRTKKANDFKRKAMIEKLSKVDARAKFMKEDRTDFQISRQLMVQQLKKDLELMKADQKNADIKKIENDYHFLRNDQEFQSLMKELKASLHANEKTEAKLKSLKQMPAVDSSSGVNIKAAMKVLRTATSQADLRKSKLGGSSPSPQKTEQPQKKGSPDQASKKKGDLDTSADGKKQDVSKKAAAEDAEKKKRITEMQAKQVGVANREQRSP
jgi:hypothetical protein